MKYSDFIFYANRSSRSWFTRAIWALQNGAKVSPGMPSSNGADNIRGYRPRKPPLMLKISQI